MNEGSSPVIMHEITHTYAGSATPVLDGVSATFHRGDVTAICGPSGSGKSTLISVLGLLMRPVTGTVSVLGELAWRSRSQTDTLRRSAFSWVLQNSACLEARPALDNVAVVLLAQGFSLDEARQGARRALQEVGLAHRILSRASELSGGELQRMTIARALSSGQPVVLADEPTGQLDAHNSDLVAAAFRACAEAGQAVVVATHDMTITRHCDRQLMLIDGELSEAE